MNHEARPIIRCEHLKKYFPVKGRKGKTQYVHAVDNVTFSMARSEIFGIVGESGSGKSTIGRCVICLESTTEGEIYYNENRINDPTPRRGKAFRSDIQMVFQNPFASFNPQKTAEQIFVELGRTHGMSRAEALGRASELLEMVNLLPQFEMLKRYPKTLSGGQLQRLAIARALMLNPSVLIADEPVSALDVSVQAQILNQFVELRDKLGLSILFISHDLTVVSNICDTVAVVYLGALMEIAPVRKLFGDVLHPYSEALISAKPKNHPKDRSERIILGGDVPNAIDIGPGCRFADRCRYRVDEICRKETPQLKEVKADRRVACHFPLVGKSII